MWPFKRKPAPSSTARWDLSEVILEWAPGVPWTLADACAGCQIFGSTGSGKSTTVLPAICDAFLRNGFGGLFLTVKREDKDTYVKYVRDAGREKDLVIFSPDHVIRYNFIEAERNATGGAFGLAESLTELLMLVADLSNDRASGHDSEPYFRLEAARLARNTVFILSLGSEPVTPQAIHRFIVDAPQSLEQVQNPQWRKGFCFRAIEIADAAPKNLSQRGDFELALTFVLTEWPALSSRTRSVVQSTLTSVTDQLSRGAVRDMISSPTPNISPAACYEGAIVIADFPVLLYQKIGQIIQVVLKACWQRAHSRRDVAANPRPTFIVADESHLLTSIETDHRFQTTARSTRTCVVNATQSISTCLDALGGAQAEPKLHALLGNLQTKLFLQQSDVRTIEYAQQLIGRTRTASMNGQSTRDQDWLAPLFGGATGGSAGFSEVFEHELQASDLNSLVKGGPPLWLAEAILFHGGRRLPNGRSWMKVMFDQKR